MGGWALPSASDLLRLLLGNRPDPLSFSFQRPQPSLLGGGSGLLPGSLNNDCVYRKEEVAFGGAVRRHAFNRFTWVAISLLPVALKPQYASESPRGLVKHSLPHPQSV